MGHNKKECPKFVAWHIKKGISLALVCSEVNLTSIPMHLWWVDSGSTTHVMIRTMPTCKNTRDQINLERIALIFDLDG